MSKLTIKELLDDIENVQSAYELAERVEKVVVYLDEQPKHIVWVSKTKLRKLLKGE